MADKEAQPLFEAPRHVAIIMDGNGRWAAARGLPRSEGHRRGVEALRRTVRAAGELGISYLTIFSFSSENWSRPAGEVAELMGLLRRFVRNDLAELHQNNVRVRVIGERADLSADIGRLLVEAEELTRGNTGSLSSSPSTTARGRRSRALRGGWPRRSSKARSTPARSTWKASALPRCAGRSRAGSDHPHQRRAAAVEFPAVAGRL